MYFVMNYYYIFYIIVLLPILLQQRFNTTSKFVVVFATDIIVSNKSQQHQKYQYHHHQQQQRILQGFGVVSGNNNNNNNTSSSGSGNNNNNNNNNGSNKNTTTNTNTGGGEQDGFGTIDDNDDGTGDGGSVTIDDGNAAIPTKAPITTPSVSVPSPTTTTMETPTITPTTDSTTLVDGIPTMTPTSGSGVVVLDSPNGGTSPTTVATETNVPSSLPISIKDPPSTTSSTNPSWLSFAVTYTSQLYTRNENNQNNNNGSHNKTHEEIVRIVHGEIRTSLQRLVKQQNVPVMIELFQSELLGTCPKNNNNSTTTSNTEKILNGEYMFPNFPICNIVKADIITKIDTSKIKENTVRDSFVSYISNTFIPTFNKNSSIGRLWYIEPIEITSTMNITMFGVTTKMNLDETNIFIDLLQKNVILNLLLNGTKNNEINMNLEEITILHQQSSSSKRKRQLQKQRLLALTATDGSTTKYDKEKFNKVEVLITTSCSRDNQCKDKVLQSFLDKYAVNYNIILMNALKDNQNYFYFDDIQNLIIGSNIIPELPPPINTNTNNNNDNATNNTSIEKSKTPMWVIILIIAVCIILISTIIYIVTRRSIRRIQGDRMKDGITKDEEKNILRNSSYTPTAAPSFQQIQEWTTNSMNYNNNSNNNNSAHMSMGRDSNNNNTNNNIQHQPRDTISSSIFHKRGSAKVQQPIYEYEVDDEYNYDPRYNDNDNDQFSVEPGNFDTMDNGYDDQQWNSSFRSYT